MFFKLIDPTLKLSLMLGPRLLTDVKTLHKFDLQSYLTSQHAPKLMVVCLW